MISVVINAYNAEKYIREVLDAILKQTVLPHEIIIVNDGSTDNSWDQMISIGLWDLRRMTQLRIAAFFFKKIDF